MNRVGGLEPEKRPSDPAERKMLRLFYRGWRPTRLGLAVNRVQSRLSALGLPPRFQQTLEVRGRRSGRTRANAVVVVTVDGRDYLVSMLGPGSEWVRNVKAAGGAATLRHGRRRQVQLVPISKERRAPIIREYVRIAWSGGQHLPVKRDAPLAEFEAIADLYPVFRVDPV